MKNEINLIYKNISESDKELFLGPFDKTDGPIIEYDNCNNMSQLLHLAGLFKSVSDAKRNGWNKEIPKGYQHIIFGKRKLNLYILHELNDNY